MSEIEQILNDLVAAHVARYNIAVKSGDGVSQDEDLILWIAVLQAKLELAKWREENK